MFISTTSDGKSSSPSSAIRMKRANEPETGPAPKKRAARKQAENPRKEFSRLKLNGVDYNLGDVAVVKEWRDDRCYGTILKIWNVSQNKGQAFLRLRWFYKPSDVFPTVPAFIGSDELFDSDHEQDIYVQTVYDKVHVVPFEDYFNRAEIAEDVFFTRAKYLSASNRIDPPLDQWPTVCVCKAIKSPNEIYVECELCEQLFHLPCVGLAEGEVDKDWACERCSKK